MAQIGDFFARLFSAGGTRGLSGDADIVLQDDVDAAYFNEFLRKHRTEEDFAVDPAHLWSAGAFLSRKQGLEAHLLANRGDGVAGFTDILVVVNAVDFRRGQDEAADEWKDRAVEALTERFTAFCEDEDFHLVHPQRGIRFLVVEDGGAEMEGSSLHLKKGEFVTGLLPNTYVGPVVGSRPIIAVLLNLPGFWEGYQEVGRLYSDQILFTLGTHWLDSFCHPALHKPALYRLQRYSDGSFVHIVNPEFQSDYRITSHETPDGPAVLSIESESGEAVGHMVLAIVGDTLAEQTFEEVEASRPGIEMPVPDADGGAGTGAFIRAGNRTVVPSDVEERIFTLHERGALLQKVHFSKFMEGYDVYLGENGELGTAIAAPAATFQVRGRTVSLVPLLPGLKVDGKKTTANKAVRLTGEVDIELKGQTLRYRDLSGEAVDGWPYLGELKRQGGTVYMVFGGAYKIGRDRRCKVRLPDEPHNENIVWLPSMAEGGTIRSRNGEIPKSRFYTDSIMVASEHAEIDLRKEPVLFSSARHCYTYVRRGQDVFALAPTKGHDGSTNFDLRPGDEILIGNQVFAVAFPPADGPLPVTGVSAGGAEPPPISAQDLAKAADPPDTSDTFEDLDDISAVPRLPRATADGQKPDAHDDDVPAAAGLGERGPAPAKPMISAEGLDSILGLDAPDAARLRKSLELHSGAKAPTPQIAPPMMIAPTIEYERDALLKNREMLESGGAFDDTESPTDLGEPMMFEEIDARGEVDVVEVVDDSGVAVVDEEAWQLELSRPARLALVGWMVSGEVTVANHHGAAIAVPENRSVPDQEFRPTDYFQLFVRGRRARVQLLSEDQARLTKDGKAVHEVLDADGAQLVVLRRDAEGEEDFDIRLTLVQSGALPDPRARLLEIDASDRMVAGMFTLGFPLRASRRVSLGPIQASAVYDGSAVMLSDYLSTYRKADGGFEPFFVRSGDGPFRTVPEDGAPIVLSPGDELIVGSALYTLRT